MALVYRQVIGALDRVVPQKFQPFWNHAAGPKTVFFWAPMFKWVKNCKIGSDGTVELRPKSHWFSQIEGQLNITGRLTCYLILYTPAWIHVIIIKKDEKYWTEEMVPKLEKFYNGALLPEIVEPMLRKRGLFRHSGFIFFAGAGLVVAGIGDLARPADKLSIPQSLSLAATGTIWSRYSLVIIPKNWSLFSVNVFVGITSIYQLTRAYKYQKSLEAEAAKEPASS